MTSQIRVDEITNRSGLGTVTIYDNGFEFTGVTTFTEDVDITGGLTIGGVLTYEDVTNIDSVGVVTARAGLHVTGGNLGVGLNNPDRALSVSDQSNGNLARFIGPTNNLFIMNDRSGIIDLNSSGTGDHLCLGTQNTERLRITSTGDVGINCTPHSNAGINLHIHGDNTTSEIRLTNTTTGTGANGSYIQQGGNTLYIGNTENGNTVFEVNGSERVRIDSVGNMGIGGAALPITSGYNGATLHLRQSANSGGSHLRMTNGSTGHTTSDGFYMGYWQDGHLYCYNQEAGHILVGTNGTERFRIASDGKIHIGGNGTGTDQLNIIGAGNGINISRANSGSPSANDSLGALGFKGYATGNSSAAADAKIHAAASHNHSGSSAPANLIFSTKPTTTGPGSAPTERMRLTYDGLMGLGTADPQGELHVKRTSSTGRIIVEGAALAQIGLRDNAGGTDSKVIQIRNNAQNLLFGTQNDSWGSFSEKVRIRSSGGITFNGDTAAANALDDYEEGTWQPVVTSNGTNPSYSVTNNYSYYIKIGRLVHFNVDFYATISSVGSGGSIYISIPFTVDTSSSNKMEQYVGGMGGRAQTAFNLSRQEIGWYYASSVMYMRHQNKDTYDESGSIGTGDLRSGQVRFNLDGWFYSAS